MEDAVRGALLSGFVPLVVAQCLIGLLNLRLTSNYRRQQRESSRAKVQRSTSARRTLELEQRTLEVEQFDQLVTPALDDLVREIESATAAVTGDTPNPDGLKALHELVADVQRALAAVRAAQETNVVSPQQLNALHELLREAQGAASAIASGAPGLDGDVLQRLKALGVASAQGAARPRKLGIALAGGGGKGAYQVGVLRALRAAGVRPDVIAGTSVGALNATLLCLDELEFATDFWSQVSFRRIARVSIANLAAIPLILCAVVTAGNSEIFDRRLRRTILMQYYALILPANVLGVLFGGVSWIIAVANVAACVTVVTLGYVAEPLVGLLGLALLSNRPLAAKIGDTVAPGRLRATQTPLYVTVAARRRTINPNSPVWYGKRILVARQPYVPEYRHLQHEPDADIQRIVLQSAAIPFGVFPLRRIGRSGYVDGGVADNVPIQPLVAAGCTCIVVIHLDPNGECDGWRLTDPDDLWARLGHLRELRRLATLTDKHTVDELASQARLREASPDVRREEVAADLRSDYSRENVSVVHIVPSEPLGNFLTGTMNFNKRKARRLIELGERDAQKALSGLSDLAAWTG